jgi:hypothetical protein
MKNINIFILILSALFMGCSSDDDPAVPLDAVLVPTGINFVKASGENIDSYICADATIPYAIRVDARFEGEARPSATRLDFEVNGENYSVTFATTGFKIVPINIRTGDNKAQVSGTNISSLKLKTTAQGGFVEVQ